MLIILSYLMSYINRVFFVLGAVMTTLVLVCPAFCYENESGIQQKIYVKDRLSVQMVSGVLSSPTCIASRTPAMNYWQTNIRFAWMFSELKKRRHFLRGNFEALLEITNSFIYKGPGNYIGGLTGLVRYNFGQPDWKLVPYLQAGVGFIYTDTYKEDNAPIGQALEFNPQLSFGIRRLINQNWSIDAEAMFHHMSNAGMDDINEGINASGGFIGLTYYFDRLFGG